MRHAQLVAQVRRENLCQVCERGQPHVGLVNAVTADGLVVGHARERRLQRYARGCERSLQKPFCDAKHRLLLRKRHFQVNLRELRLAVGAQVLIAKAAHDLKVAVKAGDHQDLLEQLRRLRQGVEVSRVDPAGDEVIARAFRGGARQERRFNFQETFAGEILPDSQRDLVAQLEIGLHLGPAQVEIAVLEAHFLVLHRVVRRRKRRHFGVVQDKQLLSDHFHLAGRHFRIDGRGIARPHVANYGNDEFRPDMLSFGVRFRGGLLVQNHLRDTGAVPDIKENQGAVVAAAVDPAHQGDLLACGCVVAGQEAAAVRALQSA